LSNPHNCGLIIQVSLRMGGGVMMADGVAHRASH
jgi:hypothetical protein